MNHIITPEEVRQYGRNMSAHIERKTLEVLIEETENMDIRPVLGIVFFQNLLANQDTPFNRILLNGGYYPYVFDPTFDATFEGVNSRQGSFDLTFDATFEERNIILDAHFQGLKAAVAYYVQAKLAKTNDNQFTRFGIMQKDSEYGHRPTLAERNDTYNDLCYIADQYLRDTLEYLYIYATRYPLYQGGERITNNRTIYRIIGE